MKKMSINEMVLHPIQLEKVELLKLTLENSGRASEFESLSITTEVSVHGYVIDSNHGKAILELKILATHDETKVYEILIQYQGSCVVDGEADIEAFKAFLQIQSIHLLWPYMREAIPSLLIKMDVDPIKIPTIDVIKNAEKMAADNVSE